MDEKQIKDLLEQFRQGTVVSQEYISRLKNFTFEQLPLHNIEPHRAVRQGWPETIFCEGKTTAQIIRIAESILNNGSRLLATRISKSAAIELQSRFTGLNYNETARVVASVPQDSPDPAKGHVAVICAGTGDIPVAEEAVETLSVLSISCSRIYDVGVAGIHRLFEKFDAFENADYIIVCAGMEGALASVIGGLVGAPIVAVPTSIGYGASFNGLAALLAMLNSCAAGISVVNIDNGFGAACVVARQVYRLANK